MKIKKEDFDKLKQLDRIEFRQKRDYIERYFDNGNLGSWDFFYNMLAISGFVMIIGLLFYNINPSSTYKLLGIFPMIIKLTIGFFILLKVGEIFLNYKQKKELEKLEEEYFKIEVKNK